MALSVRDQAVVTDPGGRHAGDRPAEPDPRHEETASRRRWAVAIAATGGACMVLVGWHGSATGRMVRMALVVGLTLGSLWLDRRHGKAVRGVGGLAVGLVGTTAGLGIGLMHLAKSDLDVIGLAGLVALGGGLYLLVASLAFLYRATPGWWRLLGLPVAFLLFQFVVVPFTVAIYSTNLPSSALGSATPATRGFAYDDVTLTTADRVRLAAWYIPSRNGAAAVLLHGAGSTRTSVLDQATVLARHGYGVLLVDARGHGRSGGDAQDNGWWGDRDLSAAVTGLSTRPDVVGGRIGAVGISMGGEEAIGAAAGDPRIRAVVADGALWRGAMDDGWLPRSFTGSVDRVSLRVQTALTALLTSAPTPPSLASALAVMSPRPVLLIAGRPELQGDRLLRRASPTNVQLWELPDTGHTAGLATHPTEWEAHVIGFLNAKLLAGQESPPPRSR